MSDSKGNDITNPDAAVCNLTTTLDATRTPVVRSIIDLSTLTNLRISTINIAYDRSVLAAVLLSLVGDIFALGNKKLVELSTQLATYFKGNGI